MSNNGTAARKNRSGCPALVGLINQGHEIIVTHGNGPQVGMINLAFDSASATGDKVAPWHFPECAAMSQGYIGDHLQNAIMRELRNESMPWYVATVVTQTVVDENDPAFQKPTKPIGGIYTSIPPGPDEGSIPTGVLRRGRRAGLAADGGFAQAGGHRGDEVHPESAGP